MARGKKTVTVPVVLPCPCGAVAMKHWTVCSDCLTVRVKAMDLARPYNVDGSHLKADEPA